MDENEIIPSTDPNADFVHEPGEPTIYIHNRHTIEDGRESTSVECAVAKIATANQCLVLVSDGDTLVWSPGKIMYKLGTGFFSNFVECDRSEMRVDVVKTINAEFPNKEVDPADYWQARSGNVVILLFNPKE